jgi:hypothetical protein
MEMKSLIFISILFLSLHQGSICYGQPNFAYNVTYNPPTPMNLVITPPESFKPQVAFSPINLSFTESDWQLENGKSIKISIYIPPHTHINELQSKFSIPRGWDVIPNAEISRTTYVQAQDTIYAYDLNSAIFINQRRTKNS